MNSVPLPPAMGPNHPAAGSARAIVPGLVGVAIFSVTLIATHAAVAEFDAAFVASGRALFAAGLAIIDLLARRAKAPPRADFGAIARVSLGVVIGFPLFSSMAMRSLEPAHGAVVTGILPLSTAVFAVLLAHERPPLRFWIAAVAGSIMVAGFAMSDSNSEWASGDLFLVLAILLAGMGYAEGARLARRHGGRNVIAWALIAALPLSLPATFWFLIEGRVDLRSASWTALAGLAYVSAFSMWIGFMFWYRGLETGGIARIGQLQLLQPFLTLAFASLLLGEAITARSVLYAMGVAVTVVVGNRRANGQPKGRPGPGTFHLRN